MAADLYLLLSVDEIKHKYVKTVKFGTYNIQVIKFELVRLE